jgi:hypothetical protein
VESLAALAETIVDDHIQIDDREEERQTKNASLHGQNDVLRICFRRLVTRPKLSAGRAPARRVMWVVFPARRLRSLEQVAGF